MVAMSSLPTKERPQRLSSEFLTRACVAAKSTYSCYEGQVLVEEEV